MAPSRSCASAYAPALPDSGGLAVSHASSFVVVRPRRWRSQSNGKTSMETIKTGRCVLDATRVTRGTSSRCPFVFGARAVPLSVASLGCLEKG
jgi:hypothetical protein